ncbi:MAG: hypothetical protein CFE43_06985 [Burkholderiales bacterium PBB3]|nr:MAG: hypothetical protein CFE43_06985 [Burkholderiales bacterium PBB3]
MNNAEAEIIPYHTSSVPETGAVLVFAPHPDDEVFGCGGALLLHVQNGQKTRVILLTAGDGGGENGSDDRYAELRMVESKSAALVLGMPEPVCWGLKDRSLAYGEPFVQRIMDAICESGASIIYAPSLWEVHPDHRATAMSVVEAVRRLGGQSQLLLYEVSAPLRPNKLIDISSVWDRKADAMQCFPSQNSNLAYPDFVYALNRFRALTLDKSVTTAEGYEWYAAESLNLPAQSPFGSERSKLWARGVPTIASDVPQISVVIRTKMRSTLASAIDSVVAQTYANIELVLVDVAGNGLVDLDLTDVPFPVRIASEHQQLSRSRAANVGLKAASGQFCIFLDDDDWFYPDHISKLAQFLVYNPALMAVHTGVVCVDGAGQSTGVIFDFPYAARELAYGNFMPIHGVMFSRSLIDRGCLFDERFDIYEDWDFWQQVETHTPFGFVSGVSAAYRIDALSGAGVRLDQELAKRATAQMYSKWSVVQSDVVFQELVSRALARRHLSRSVDFLQSEMAEKNTTIRFLSDKLVASEERAAMAVHEANSARQDADHFRRAHDLACADREFAKGAKDNAILQIAIAHNESLQAYAELGLARAESKNAREAEAHAQEVLADLRGLFDRKKDELELLAKSVESLSADLASSRDNYFKLQIEFTENTANSAVQRKHLDNVLKQQAAMLSELERVRSERQELNELVEVQALESADRQALITHQQSVIEEMQASNSWKITSPMRAVSRRATRLRTIFQAVKLGHQKQMPWLQIIARSFAVLRTEGVQGLKRRVIRLNSNDFEPPSLATSLPGSQAAIGSYAEWVEKFDSFNDSQMASLYVDVRRLTQKPLISLVMPVHNTVEEDLVRAIESVVSQVYTNWELCICDDASTAPHVKDVLRRYEESNSKIRVRYQSINGHISKATNEAIGMVTGKYVAFFDHDDQLSPHALLRLVEYIEKFPHAMVFYSDEDKIDTTGYRFDPYFKSDFNLGLLRSHNYMCHFAVYEVGFLLRLGGLSIGLEGAQDYDLALRAVDATAAANIVHVPHVLYHWRTAVGSTASGHSEKSYAFTAGQRALDAHYVRRGLPASAAEAPEAGGMYRTRWHLPYPLPLVSIVIPTRNGEVILRQCLDSLQQTTYDNYEIVVVDNGSDDPATIEMLKSRELEGEIRVLRDDRPFNFSALNNRAVKELAQGDFVLLLNNDVEVINRDWLSEMVGCAIEEGIGCVGARLWYPDGRLQHAGIILVCGVAGHAHKYFPRGHHGYMGRAVLSQDMIGVTAACLLVKRNVYLEVGGLDEGLAVAFNDVDFCLKVHSAGYRNHFTPYAELIHHESVTRGYEDTPEKQRRFRLEIEKMQARWPILLAHEDPYYSPNLTASAEDFSLAWPPRRILP